MIRKKYDVICVGSGFGGFAAAVAAARMGLNTLLVERAYAPGGEGAEGIGFLTGNGKGEIWGEIAGELLRRLKQYSGCADAIRRPARSDMLPLNGEAVKVVMMQMCREAGVELLFACVPVQKEGPDSFRFFGKGQELVLEAKMFVDGTPEGELAALAGAECLSGAAQTGRLPFTVSQVSMEKLLEYARAHSGEVWVSGDERCLEGFGSLLDQARREGCALPFETLSLYRAAEQGRLVVDGVSVPAVDGSDPESLSAGTEKASLQALQLYGALRACFPGFEGCRLSSANHVLVLAPSRHIRCQTSAALTGVCRHRPLLSLTLSGVACGVPLGALLPCGVDRVVLAGAAVAAEPAVQSILRTGGAEMAIGEAAGVYAALSAQLNRPASEEEVRQALSRKKGFEGILA